MAFKLYENSHPFIGTLVTMMGISFALGAAMDFFLLTKVKTKSYMYILIIIMKKKIVLEIKTP